MFNYFLVSISNLGFLTALFQNEPLKLANYNSSGIQ